MQSNVESPISDELKSALSYASGNEDIIIQNGLSTNAIIGISIGVLAAVVIIGVLTCLLLRKTRQRAKVETAEYNDATPPQYEAMAEHQEYDNGKREKQYAASLAVHGPAELDSIHEPIELDSRSLSPVELPS